MVPALKGLGYGMLLVRFLVNIYYVVICAWAFFYLFAGFTSELPWGTCTEDWNTMDCYSLDYAHDCQDQGRKTNWDMKEREAITNYKQYRIYSSDGSLFMINQYRQARQHAYLIQLIRAHGNYSF